MAPDVFETPTLEVRLELLHDEVRQCDSLGFELFDKARMVLFDEGVEGVCSGR